MDTNMQLTINNFSLTRNFPHISLIFSKIPDICLTLVKFTDIFPDKWSPRRWHGLHRLMVSMIKTETAHAWFLSTQFYAKLPQPAACFSAAAMSRYPNVGYP